MRLEDYTVGWICAIPTEFVAACELLDEEHGRDRIPEVIDGNSYKFGRIHEHNVVIACLPKGCYGITQAAIVAERMHRSFTAIRFGLMVGIAGGAPSKNHDIRLGDVVVSSPTPGHSGVIQYDFGKALENHDFVETGHLAAPPDVLLTAIASLETQHKRKGHRIAQTITNMITRNRRLQAEYGRPDSRFDKLYVSLDGQEQLASRAERSDSGPVIHYGLIASANRLMKDRLARDALVKKHDVLCFEMEAAGLMTNNLPCLVIRGICDYSDMHKNDDWQGYAAATAAAYAKELLEIMPGKDVNLMKTTEQAINQLDSKNFDVPFSLDRVPIAKKFINRPSEMQMLRDALLPRNQKSRRKLFVLRGMGGIGKTQLAVEFMRLHHDEFSAIFWLDGSSNDSLKQSISQLAKSIPANPKIGQGDLSTTVTEVMNWLGLSGNNRWLMIFDNVDRDFTTSNPDPLSYDIKKYIPPVDHGSILVTTRLVQLESLGGSKEVKKVDNNTARAILRSWDGSSSDENDTQALLERLDGLPLAIAQAGSYLHQKGITIKTYLRLYDAQEKQVAEALHKSDVSLGDYRDRSVWTTWNISFDAISAINRQATNLLILWSFLDRNDLWYDLFNQASRRGFVTKAIRRNLGDIAVSEISFINVMSLLRSYSLIEGSEHTEGYMMHTVVHRWIYFYYGTKHLADLGVLALTIIGMAVPDFSTHDSTRIQRRLLPHANMCSKLVADIEALLLQDRRHDTRIDSQFDSKDVDDCLEAVGMLGYLYDCQDKFVEAEVLYKRALEDKEKILGAEHILTLRAVADLGFLYITQGYPPYGNRGKLVEAELLLKRALEGQEKALGAEHKDTLDTINSLGDLYCGQYKLVEAEEMYLRAIESKKKRFGAEHTNTIDSIHNLGLLYRDQGKLVEAEKTLMQALEGYKKQLGAGHTYTMETVHNLGLVYNDQGKLAEAEQMFMQVLQSHQALVGAEACETYIPALRNLWSLADVYAKNRPKESRAMYEKVLAGFTIVQGASSVECIQLRKYLAALDVSQSREEDIVESGSSTLLEDKPKSKAILPKKKESRLWGVLRKMKR